MAYFKHKTVFITGVSRGIGINALWPRSIVATAAVANLVEGNELMKHARTPKLWRTPPILS